MSHVLTRLGKTTIAVDALDADGKPILTLGHLVESPFGWDAYVAGRLLSGSPTKAMAAERVLHFAALAVKYR